MRSWPFARYDNQKIETYWRILPLENSPSIKIKTLIYKDIKYIKWHSDDSYSDTWYVLNNGRSQSIAISGKSYKSTRVFHRNLCTECNWLKDDIEEIYGTNYLNNDEIDNTKNSMSDTIYCIVFIWGIFIQYICLIFYTLKIKL
jgi:hypothetical protein